MGRSVHVALGQPASRRGALHAYKPPASPMGPRTPPRMWGVCALQLSVYLLLCIGAVYMYGPSKRPIIWASAAKGQAASGQSSEPQTLNLLDYATVSSSRLHLNQSSSLTEEKQVSLSEGAAATEEQALIHLPLDQSESGSTGEESAVALALNQSDSLPPISLDDRRGKGKQRRRKRGGRLSPSHTLTLYELYYSKFSWPHLHDRQPFRGLCVMPGKVRTNSMDVDAPSLLPILNDVKFQGQMCEYAAVFALDKNLATVHGNVPWLGFQSWKARSKGFGLTGPAIRKLILHLRMQEAAGDTKAFYYWSTWGIKDFYADCNQQHPNCDLVFSAAFERMFSNDSSVDNGINGQAIARMPGFLPPLPIAEKEYSYCSYWVMHKDHFQRFAAFARMFFVTVETLWDLHANPRRCPIKFASRNYDYRRCWCFLLERLVNIWAYHSGTRMFVVNHNSGAIDEEFALHNRTKWSHWFDEGNLEHFTRRFAQRLPQRTLMLHRQLGGNIF